MRQAVELATELGHGPTLFVALYELGRQLGKEDLAESMVVRYRARAQFETLDLAAVPDAHERGMLQRSGANLAAYLGVGELDSGD